MHVKSLVWFCIQSWTTIYICLFSGRNILYPSLAVTAVDEKKTHFHTFPLLLDCVYSNAKLPTWGHPCPSVLSCGPLRQGARTHQAWCILFSYSVSFIISLKVCFDTVVYHYILYILSDNIYSCIHEYIHIAPRSWPRTHRTWFYSFLCF